MTYRRVADPAELAELFSADPVSHLYGLADLEEPFWSHSSWYRRDDATVGFISVGEGWTFGYAMSAGAEEDTMALLAELHDHLPPGTWVTGPVGLAESIRPARFLDAKGVHQRMVLEASASVTDEGQTSQLSGSDLPAIEELMAHDPGAAFYQASMVEQGSWRGIWEDDHLVACAGTHVLSDQFGVAAIGGVMTRPSHRGRGLGRAVTAAVCAALVGRIPLIGLNVNAANHAAVKIYSSLGFRDALEYEEIELL